jgi:hypothetical protein
MRGAGRSEPRDVPPRERGAADQSRRTPLLLHAADGKRVFQAAGPVERPFDDAAMREFAESEALASVAPGTCTVLATLVDDGDSAVSAAPERKVVPIVVADG